MKTKILTASLQEIINQISTDQIKISVEDYENLVISSPRCSNVIIRCIKQDIKPNILSSSFDLFKDRPKYSETEYFSFVVMANVNNTVLLSDLSSMPKVGNFDPDATWDLYEVVESRQDVIEQDSEGMDLPTDPLSPEELSVINK